MHAYRQWTTEQLLRVARSGYAPLALRQELAARGVAPYADEQF